jgi:integrase
MPRKDDRGRNLRTGEYYNAKTKLYQFRKMVDGQRVTISDTDLAELRKRENEILVNIDRGNAIINRNRSMSLNEYFVFWLNTYAVNKIKASTLSKYKQYYGSYVRDNVGKKTISKITKVDIQNLFNGMCSKSLTYSTLNIVRAALNGVFECALDDDVVSKNPCRNTDIGSNDKKEKNAIPSDQLDTLMDFVKNSEYALYYPLFVVLLNTGIRVSELSALTWDDVDFKKGSISVNKTLENLDKSIYKMGYAIASTPKTNKSTRTITMNEVTRKALLMQKMLCENKAAHPVPIINRRGDIIGECSDFVFRSTKNRVMLRRTIEERIKAVIKACNKQNRGYNAVDYFSCHATRHTFTTRAYENNADMKVVSELLGHSSTAITYDIYTHINEKKKKEMENVVKSISIG